MPSLVSSISWLLAAALGGATPTLPVTIRDYGVSFTGTTAPPVERGRLLVRVSEHDHATDFDGDGRLASSVLHVIDLETGRVVNTTLPATHAAFSGDPSDAGRRIVAVLPDPDEPYPAHRIAYYDTDEDEVLETRIALELEPVFVDFNDSGLAIHQSELWASLHFGAENADLNGDDDWNDSVTYWSDGFESPRLIATGRPVALRGTSLLLAVNENGQTEFNGDDNASDSVPALFDVASMDTTVIPLSLGPWQSHTNKERNGLEVPRSEDWFALRVFESGQGKTDLNGDGDHADDVLHVHFPAGGVTVNTGVAVERLIEPELVAGHDPAAAEDYLAYTVDERAQGADLDGDGFVGGWMLVLQDLRGSAPVVVRHPPFAVELQQWGRFVSFWEYAPLPDAVWSFPQGHRRTLMIYDTHTGRATRTRYSSSDGHPLDDEAEPRYERLAGPFVLHHRAEDAAGADLNGDGDTDDRVVAVYDARDDAIRNLGLVGRPAAAVEGDRAVLLVWEFPLDADLNGDGKLYNAAFAADLALGRAAPLPPTVLEPGQLYRGEYLTSWRESVFHEDFTGDGDEDDRQLIGVSIPWDALR